MPNFEIQETIKFKDTRAESTSYLLKDLKTGYPIHVISSPSGNCQTFAISKFVYVMQSSDDCKNVVARIKELALLCGINKRLCQLDIRYEHYLLIKEYVTIHAEVQYVNLTGNRMVLLLVKI